MQTLKLLHLLLHESHFWIRVFFGQKAGSYLEVHELHELGDFRFQDLHCFLIDLNPVGLLVAFHLANTRGRHRAA